MKYFEILSRFANCPPDDYKEIDGSVYRWVHSEENLNDFEPVNIIKSPPQRIIDSTDLMCQGYGLSMFDTLENALNRYTKLYNSKRPNQKHIFTEDMGTMIANLNITKSDGVASTPKSTNFGHFTFHEYENTNLRNAILNSFNIFKENGEYND